MNLPACSSQREAMISNVWVCGFTRFFIKTKIFRCNDGAEFTLPSSMIDLRLVINV